MFESNYTLNVYWIVNEDDKKIKVLGSTHLDELMNEVKIGDYIRITYNGFRKTSNGYDMKMFNLERRIDYDD